MATFNINGMECNFYNIQHATLQNYLDGYGVTPRTHILAWQTLEQTLQLAVVMQIHAMHTIGAVEIPPQCVEDGNRTCFLLEHPNATVLQHVVDWIAYAGVKYISECPYAIVRGQQIADLEREQRFEKYKSSTYVRQLSAMKAEILPAGGTGCYKPIDEDGRAVFERGYTGTLGGKPVQH